MLSVHDALLLCAPDGGVWNRWQASCNAGSAGKVSGLHVTASAQLVSLPFFFTVTITCSCYLPTLQPSRDPCMAEHLQP